MEEELIENNIVLVIVEAIVVGVVAISASYVKVLLAKKKVFDVVNDNQMENSM